MTDPNTDLYGFTYEHSSGETVTVTGPCPWSIQYVNVKIGDYETIKPVGVVRRHKQLIGK